MRFRENNPISPRGAGMKNIRGRVIVAVVLAGVAAAATAFAQASGGPPSPGVVAGGFCTYGKGDLSTSTEAARLINQYFVGATVGSEIFHVGAGANTYAWQ